jgi:hypothetical protein
VGDFHHGTIVVPHSPDDYGARYEYVPVPVPFNASLNSIFADYAVVIIGAVFAFASVSWMVSARKWFHGPIKTSDNETGSMSSVDDKRTM